MKDHNYITILGWMVNRLELSGNELMAYAMIHGFSQDEESKYEGSGKYIADSLGISKRQVFTILEGLVKKGYINKYERFERNLKFCDYMVAPEFLPENNKNKGSEETSPVMKLLHGEGDENTSPVVNNLHRGNEKTSPEGDEETSPAVNNFRRGDEKTSPEGDEETSPHITNTYINNTTTATEQPDLTAEKHQEALTAAAEALSPEDVKKAILEIDRSVILKSDFYPRAAAFMSLNFLDRSYLIWLYKQVEMRNPDNFDGLFFKLFFAENLVEKFKLSKLPPKPPPLVEIKCPVCGAVHDKELEKCPLCSLPKDSSSGNIDLFKKLRILTPDRRDEYLQKVDDIYINFNPFVPAEVEKRENMIKALNREFGLGVKNEEPSLCHHS
ncbi:hypothetical protein R84B8_02739 [Treponema sp. R8-4-B8]